MIQGVRVCVMPPAYALPTPPSSSMLSMVRAARAVATRSTREWRGRQRHPPGCHTRSTLRVGELLVCYLVVLIVCALILGGCGDSFIAPHPLGITYTATDLGVAPRHLTGGDLIAPDAFIRGINWYGQIVGDLDQKTLFWTPTAPQGTIGTLIDLAGVLKTPCFHIDAINTYGQVAGVARPSKANSSSGCSGEEHVFLWTPSASNGTVGTVAYIDQGVGVIGPGVGVWALNDWGQLLLDAQHSSVLWTPGTEHGAVGVTTPISPVGGDDSAEALGLNAYGQVIAQSYHGDRYSHAFLWTPSVPHGTSGTVTILRSDGGEATTINDYGQVLGATITGTNDYLWTPKQANTTSGTTITLGALPGDASADFHGLSETGGAFGTSFRFGILGFGSGTHAVVWLPNGPNQTGGGLVRLGAVASDADSWGSDMNAAGQVVGSSCTLSHGRNPVTCSTQAHAFVWDSKHGLHNLQALLDDGAMFHLENALKISNQGQIVAIGDDADQQPHLLLLTPHQ